MPERERDTRAVFGPPGELISNQGPAFTSVTRVLEKLQTQTLLFSHTARANTRHPMEPTSVTARQPLRVLNDRHG